jgi:NAD(P)-dependent dehydrogenase (short-subunit alcohol dehydrogenase family)
MVDQTVQKTQKTWFVTGAGSGIGAGVARAALKAGQRVIATGRNTEKVHRALADIANDNLLVQRLDITNEAEVKTAVDAAIARFGGIDVLVNNAGYSLLGNFEEFTIEQIERQFSTNFYGVVHVMRAVLPIMRHQRSGHIINVSSVAGVVGLNQTAAYSATKFAVEGLSLSVAQEVESLGIKITVVEPGFFRTDLLDPRSVEWSNGSIADYGSAGSVPAAWEVYHGHQPGDPEKLGDALVKIAEMENPPHVFSAGSDALTVIEPAIEARLRELKTYAALSRSTDGTFALSAST